MYFTINNTSMRTNDNTSIIYINILYEFIYFCVYNTNQWLIKEAPKYPINQADARPSRHPSTHSLPLPHISSSVALRFWLGDKSIILKSCIHTHIISLPYPIDMKRLQLFFIRKNAKTNISQGGFKKINRKKIAYNVFTIMLQKSLAHLKPHMHEGGIKWAPHPTRVAHVYKPVYQNT